jgi:hypothetical protein
MRFLFFRLNKSQPIRRSNKSQPIRKKLSQSDALISEVLERRQMLSANDTVYFDVTLFDKDSTDPQPVSWENSSASYSAPWTIFRPDGSPMGQNGLGSQGQWTSNNSLSATDGAINLKEGIVHTISDFKTALESGDVKEVSDDLIGLFADNVAGTLYNPVIERAWGFSSDSLYTLLVLNSRYPGTTTEGVYAINAKVNQAMQRLVGFGFTGNWTKPGDIQGVYDPNQNIGDNIPFPNDFRDSVSDPSGNQPQISIFSKNEILLGARPPATFSPTPKLLGQPEKVPFLELDLQVPTVQHFFKFTNNEANGRGETNAPQLPHPVLKELQGYYRDAAANHDNSIEVFAEISGITNLSHLLMFPNILATNHLPTSVVYDALNIDLTNNPNATLDQTKYDIYREACSAVGGYYNPEINSHFALEHTYNQVSGFFTTFAQPRLHSYNTEMAKLSAQRDQTVIDKDVKELAIGLRALMALAYDASPFWTSYGIGFSNTANPMYGESLASIQGSSSFIDLFNGQEIQLRNIYLPGQPNAIGSATTAYTLPVMPLEPANYTERTNPLLFDNYTTNGWFELKAVTPLSGVQFTTPANTTPDGLPSYKESYEITSHATAVVFDKTTTSSDTLDASGVSLLSGTYLTPTTTVDINTDPTELRTLHRIVGHPKVLPAEFTTYISLAGGYDRVTGSDFADVIVGPTSDAPHGRLTVNAGPGDDVISPGRGGSLVELGTGADKVIFDHGDLFGIANFLDFRISDGDTLVIAEGIHVDWHRDNPDTLILSSAAGTKTLRLTPIGSDGDMQWNPELVTTISTSSEASIGELNYIETHTLIDPATTDLSEYQLLVSTPILNYSMDRNQLRAGDSVSVALGGYSKTYTADVFNHLAPEKVGFVIDFEKDGFTQLQSGLDPTISITPLRQPVDVNFEIFTGQVTAGVPNLQAHKGTTVTFTVQNIDHTPGYAPTPNVIPYMEVPGSSMYLFNNPAGTKDLGHILGKVTQINVNEATGAGTVTLFVDPNLDPAATLNTNDYLGWKSADAPSYGGQQIEVFVSRDNGYLDAFDSIFTAQSSHHIKATEINAAIAAEPTPTDYNFATVQNPPNIPYSAWKPIGGNQIAFMGGLANYLHTNNLDYDPSLPSNGYYAPVEVSIDDELLIDSGPGKINLSSSFSVFELPPSTPVQLQNICNLLNTVSKDPDGYSSMPAGIPAGAQFMGTRALVTGSQVVINGSGRINNWNIYNDPYYQYGAHNTKPDAAHDDVASNIYYTIGSDILTVSSTHTPKPADTYQNAIIAASFTSAWPVIKGIGGVRFQDFDYIDIVSASGATLESAHSLRHQYPKLQFRDSSAQLLNHKQLGGWNWQADGPQIAGWNSLVKGNFIHANDDSLKIGAPNSKFKYNTVVQGKAGVALGTSYGYLNGGFAGSTVDGLYAHRIVTDDRDVALATAWASPTPEYFYDHTTSGVATTVPQTLNVQDVFVPQLQFQIAKSAQDVTKKGTVVDWDLNEISTGAAVDFQSTLRGTTFPTESTAPFQVDLGLINMHNNWEINTEVPKPNYVQLQNNSNWPNTKVISSPPYSSYRNYQNAENSWAMAGAGGTVTVTQGNQNINLFSSHNDTRIKRPELKRASKIRLNRDSNVIGPQPIRLMHSHIEDAVNANPSSGENHSYIVTNVASGKVEKKVGTTYIDVNAPLMTSSPLAMIAWLKNRMISAGEEIRYVAETEDQGEVTARAFELIGWDGSSISEERTSVEIDASGWQDF